MQRPIFYLYYNPHTEAFRCQEVKPDFYAGLLLMQSDIVTINKFMDYAAPQWRKPNEIMTVEGSAKGISRIPAKKIPAMTKIYLMRDSRSGYVKIGRSKNPGHRERTLQAEQPCVEMLCFWEGDRRIEKELHERYAEKRLRGEWFDLSDADVQQIRAEFKPPDHAKED